MSDEQFESTDFFRNKDVIDDPYPYLDHLRGKCPVFQEPYHDVYMVTGYDEAIEVYHDTNRPSRPAIRPSGPSPSS